MIESEKAIKDRKNKFGKFMVTRNPFSLILLLFFIVSFICLILVIVGLSYLKNDDFYMPLWISGISLSFVSNIVLIPLRNRYRKKRDLVNLDNIIIIPSILTLLAYFGIIIYGYFYFFS
jgi:hypothetical protein